MVAAVQPTAVEAAATEISIEEALRQARRAGATDLHLLGGRPVRMRDSRGIRPLANFRLSANAVSAYLEARRSQGDSVTHTALARVGSADFAATDENGAIRVHAFQEQNGLKVCIRLLGDKPPEFASLGLPNVIRQMTDRESGLILITGPQNSGKSSLANALIDHLNNVGGKSIVTIEKPVEWRHADKNSIISQCEVGYHSNCPTFGQGVVAAMNADCNVIMIGQIATEEEAKAALNAAESGALVIATFHSQNASHAVERLVSYFEENKPQRRVQLAQTLIGIACLRLMEKLGDQPGAYIPACEILLNDEPIRQCIREGKVEGIRNQIHQGRGKGMQTLEFSLNELVAQRRIKIDAARRTAVVPEDIRG